MRSRSTRIQSYLDKKLDEEVRAYRLEHDLTEAEVLRRALRLLLRQKKEPGIRELMADFEGRLSERMTTTFGSLERGLLEQILASLKDHMIELRRNGLLRDEFSPGHQKPAPWGTDPVAP